MILTYLPAQIVVSSCRATCQELFNFINSHEDRIASTIATRELHRLQAHSNKLKAFGPPANVKDFVEGLRFFTAQRGVLTSKYHASQVVARWVRHLFRNVFPRDKTQTDKWTFLATDLIELQRAFDRDVREGKQKQNRRETFMLSYSHWDPASRLTIEHLYEAIKTWPTSQPYFPGIVHEHDTQEWRTWPKLRLTMTWDNGKCFHPVVPYELVHLLDLPRLPQDKIFFYYVDEEWVCREIKRGPLRPMLEAAVLQLVKVF